MYDSLKVVEFSRALKQKKGVHVKYLKKASCKLVLSNTLNVNHAFEKERNSSYKLYFKRI